jgi:hypothetical protein
MEKYYEEEGLGSGNYFVRHWRGDLSLPVSYWINATLIAGLVPVPLVYLSSQVDQRVGSIQYASIMLMLIITVSISGTIWAIVGTWRSSNHHSMRGGSEGWANAAKFFMFIGALRLLAQVGGMGPFVLETSQLAVGIDSMGAPAKVAVNGQDLSIVGPISLGTAESVSQALVDNPKVRRVILSSLGGRLGEAAQISEQIATRQMNTVARGECSSACTMILLAGADRSAVAGSKIGFHGPSYPGLGVVELNPAASMLADSYRAAGLVDTFVTSALAVDPSDMWYPKETELFKVGVLNFIDAERIAQGHELEALEYRRKLPLRLDDRTIFRSIVTDGTTITYNFTVDVAPGQISFAQAQKALKGDVLRKLCRQPLVPEAIASGARYVYNYDYTVGGQLTNFTIDDCG